MILALPELGLISLVEAAFGCAIDVHVPLLAALRDGVRAELRLERARLVVTPAACVVELPAFSGGHVAFQRHVELGTILSTVADLLQVALRLPFAAARAALTCSLAVEYLDADPWRDLVTSACVDAQAHELSEDELECFVDLACSARELRRAALDREAQIALVKGGAA